MRPNRIWTMVAGMAALLAAASCEPEPATTRFLPEGGREDASVAWSELPVTIAPDTPGGTKASLLRDVEAKGSGALVLVYRTATRQLDSYRFFTQEELRNQGSVPLKLRVPLTECDFYILGNLNAVHKTEDRMVNLMEALGASFPVQEDALEALVYRLDGGDLGGSWRRERFEEVAACGIPYMHVRKGVNTAARIRDGLGIPDSDKCRRLFSKVTVRIDHAAFDGGGANPEFFVNARLYLRQANARLQPFSETPQKAAEAADVLAQSDYDPDMSSTNASVTTFSFYVPENMQGNLLPGNTDSRRKTRDELLRQGRAAVEPFLTYVEFSGRLDPGAGGYGGDVTYRFYVGLDNCANFDLERNREYEIALTFRVGSLFDPDWKVGVDNWSDRRLFCLTADPAFTDRLPEGRTLAVRTNRPGALYVYMNPKAALGASNALLGRDAAASASFVPASLADCAWYGELMDAGTAAGAWLRARGITPVWDKATGRLSLTVSDASLFRGHEGETRALSLSLLPRGTTVSFTVKLLPDIGISVADGKSLTEEFYLGQRRDVTVSGFAGSRICYAADQDPCGRSAAGSAHTANVQWKGVNTESAAFPKAVVDAAGQVVLRPDAYPGQQLSGSTLSVYAFYPNRFQASHTGWSSRDGRIIFFSEDYLNDSFAVPVRISEPLLKAEADFIYLPLDGNEVQTQVGYWSYDGSVRLPADSFDPELVRTRLGLGLRAAASTYEKWMSCLTLDAGTGEMYISRTVSGDSKMEDLAYDYINGSYNASLGRFQIYPLVLTDLYGSSGQFSLRVTRLGIKRLRSGLRSIFTTGTTDYSGILMSDYYNTGKTGQLEEDTAFGVRADYSFFHGDLSRIVWERTGTAMSYTCRRPPYETIHPVIDFVVETADTGEGGSFSWVYDESHQPTASSSGEPVPGGLIVPYGQQTMKGTITNKWDGRSFTCESGFRITYPSINCDLLIVARSNQAKASVYLMPLKVSKYLKRIGASVDQASRRWMMQLFGSDAWMSKVTLSRCYQSRPGSGIYHVQGQRMGIPVQDYDVRYAMEYLHGSTTQTVWTQAALDEVASSISNRSVVGNIYLDEADYPSEHFKGLIGFTIPDGKTCIYWTRPEAF